MKESTNLNWIKKIKLSDGISILSLIVAGLALFFSLIPKSAQVEYEVLPELTSGERRDTINYTQTLVRLLIKNNGEKPVTIESLNKNINDGIYGYTESGERWNIEKSIFIKYICKDLYTKYYLSKENDSLRYFDFNEGLILNKVLEPGRNMQLNLLIKQMSNFSNELEYISFDATLKLSSNTHLPIHVEFDAKIRRRGR